MITHAREETSFYVRVNSQPKVDIHSPLLQKKLEQKPKRRVQFAQHAQVAQHISRQEMTPEEIQRVWNSQKESNAILRSCARQIQRMDQGKSLREGKDCSRGLESSTTLGRLAKKKNREAAFNQVLYQQDLHIENLSHEDGNDETLRVAYLSVSASCQMWAHTVALNDQREAELILDDIIDNVRALKESYKSGVCSRATLRRSTKSHLTSSQ